MKHPHGNKATLCKWLRMFGVITLLISGSGGTWADAVGFNPGINDLGVRVTFNVDIVGDFAELAGGVIDLGFDSDVVQINSVTINPFFDFLPNGGGPAAGDSWPGISFDFFANKPAKGNFTIATVNLTTLVGGAFDLTVLETSEFFSLTAQLSPTRNLGTITVRAPP
ncbi:MAG: hypothetical protein WBO57_02330 [Gammaproteobacteria bacterium]